MQIAIVNKSKRLTDDFVAFAAKACDDQVIECARAYGKDPTPVAFYAREQDLPARDCRIMALVDDIDAPGALGYHDFDLGIVYGRVLATDNNGTSACLSHECLEELIDPTCDQWRAMPDGRYVAFEICDPVQADAYAIPTTVMGEQRQVIVSNYVLPRWFDPAAAGGFDRLAKLRGPFQMTPGGYLIVRDQRGNESNVFARPRPRLRASGMNAEITIARKLRNSETRTARRLAG